MPVRLNVAELRSPDRRENEEFEALLLLKRCTERTARNGNPFYVAEFGDQHGSFTANVFADSPACEALLATEPGSVVHISGKVESYQGRFSPRINTVRKVSEDELQQLGGIENLIETPPEDGAALRRELEEAVTRITHERLRRTVELALEEVGDSFFTAPAAVSMHHAYRHGLVEHTVHMVRACEALLPLYPEVHADLARAGVIVHDIGKTIEYTDSLAPQKTRTGILQGHVVLGYRIVRKAGMKARLDADTLERLEHIVLSHQGELEWGAAAMAATPEAVFVSMIDNLDARMGMVQRALRIGNDAEFSDYLPGLKAPLLRTPPAIAAAESAEQADLPLDDDTL
ncbi:MAG: HD domain-containing protein [Verrucomicrobia bacterium]|nr:MAG: HD domain-containing protein [Verrucomicrobiota bacterium]